MSAPRLVFTAPAYWRWQREYVASTGALLLDDIELAALKATYRRRRAAGETPAVARVIAVGMLMLPRQRVRSAHRALGFVFVDEGNTGPTMDGWLFGHGLATRCRLTRTMPGPIENNLRARLILGQAMNRADITEDELIAEAFGRAPLEVVRALVGQEAWHEAMLRAIVARVDETAESLTDADRAASARRLRLRLQSRIAQLVAEQL